MSNGDNVTVASNVLGTIGTVLWCIQLIPQIWYNYRRKNTDGFPAAMMFLWASCMCCNGFRDKKKRRYSCYPCRFCPNGGLPDFAESQYSVADSTADLWLLFFGQLGTGSILQPVSLVHNSFKTRFGFD